MTDIYLVEDHALMRDGLRLVLGGAGHRVVGECHEPTQALAEIQALRPDVVLLDLHLGSSSGHTLLGEIVRRRLAAHTIVVTMSAQSRDVAEALRAGASGYILKGAPADDLVTAIAEVMEGRRYLGQRVADLAIAGMSHVDEASAVDSLSGRERQIVSMVVRGLSSSEIGKQLHLSPKTIDSYRSRLMAKLGVGDVTALVRFAIRAKLIDADER